METTKLFVKMPKPLPKTDTLACRLILVRIKEGAALRTRDVMPYLRENLTTLRTRSEMMGYGATRKEALGVFLQKFPAAKLTRTIWSKAWTDVFPEDSAKSTQARRDADAKSKPAPDFSEIITLRIREAGRFDPVTLRSVRLALWPKVQQEHPGTVLKTYNRVFEACANLVVGNPKREVIRDFIGLRLERFLSGGQRFNATSFRKRIRHEWDADAESLKFSDQDFQRAWSYVIRHHPLAKQPEAGAAVAPLAPFPSSTPKFVVPEDVVPLSDAAARRRRNEADFLSGKK